MDYAIYIAKIEGAATKGDSRLRVRVIPHMEGIAVDKLPSWPHFFRDKMITGTTFTTQPADYVWVIANEDFSIGYVLGLTNMFSFGASYGESSLSGTLMDAVSDAHIRLNGTTLSFNDTLITYWDGNSVHFVERSTGSYYIAFRNGTLHTVCNDKIACKVGASMFKITEDEIQMSAKNIRLNGEVRLGSNPKGKIMVSNGSGAENAVASDEVWG